MSLEAFQSIAVHINIHWGGVSFPPVRNMIGLDGQIPEKVTRMDTHLLCGCELALKATLIPFQNHDHSIQHLILSCYTIYRGQNSL